MVPIQDSGPYQAAAARRSTRASPLADRVRGINRPAVLRDTASTSAVEVLKQLVQSRWNPEAGLLNLEVCPSALIRLHALSNQSR